MAQLDLVGHKSMERNGSEQLLDRIGVHLIHNSVHEG